MPLDANWRLRGNCRFVDPDLMHPDPRDRNGQAEAKAICRTCPVQADCLTDATRVGDYGGIRAGMTGEERRAQEAAE